MDQNASEIKVLKISPIIVSKHGTMAETEMLDTKLLNGHTLQVFPGYTIGVVITLTDGKEERTLRGYLRQPDYEEYKLFKEKGYY